MFALHVTVQSNQVICQPRAWIRILHETRQALTTRSSEVGVKHRIPTKSGLRLPLELENPFKVPTYALRDAIR